MKKTILFIFFNLSFLSSFTAQEYKNDSIFKKCIKEFNKRLCLSDEDGDEILFYLDKCSKEYGQEENAGCPWPDTDGDGILDKDDQCPTIKGFEEFNGCPKPYKPDCNARRISDSLKMTNLKADHKDIDKIYNLLSKRMLDPIKKYHLNSITLYTGLINWDIHCDLPGCCPDWKNMPSNYLSSKFWNKTALENFYNRKEINAILFSTKFVPDIMPEFKEFADPSLYSFIMKYYKKDSPRLAISKGLDEKSVVVTVRIEFHDPYKLKIFLSDGNRFSTDTTYEYDGKKWNIY